MSSPAFALDTLLGLPLFAGLAPDDVAGLESNAVREDRERGEYLFRRGEAGDALYLVLAGQVALELPGEPDGELLALCGPGDWFGELALLTGGPRSADARVTVDATLLRVDRACWNALGLRVPALFSRMCERLGRQLRIANERDRRRGSRRSVVACADAAAWLPELAASVRRQFPARETHVLAADGAESALARILAPDALVLVGGNASGIAEQRLARRGPAAWTLVTLPAGDAEEIRGATPSEAIDRVARRLARGRVGLALGAGGAYGFAHLGLVDALGAAGIPIDCIAGTSMGALLGGTLAAGVPVAEAVAHSERFAARFRWMILRDLTPRGPSLLRGGTVMDLLAGIGELRDITFEALVLPFVAVAMDLGTGEAVLIRSGRVLDGIRPSIAMPGIFPPCPADGRVMIDGAMVDPVPVGPARALGADFVIASDVIPPLQPAPSDPLGSLLDRARRLAESLPLCGGLQSLETSIRSFQALWFQLSAASSAGADVVVHPGLERFWYLQFADARPIIDAGRAAAEAAIPRIRELLAARLGLAC